MHGNTIARDSVVGGVTSWLEDFALRLTIERQDWEAKSNLGNGTAFCGTVHSSFCCRLMTQDADWGFWVDMTRLIYCTRNNQRLVGCEPIGDSTRTNRGGEDIHIL